MLSIRSRRKQYAQNAQSVDDRHAAAPKAAKRGDIVTFMSFGSRAKKYSSATDHADAPRLELSELLRQAAEERGNRLRGSEYDDTTWSARSWTSYTAQRISCVLARAVAWEAELATDGDAADARQGRAR